MMARTDRGVTHRQVLVARGTFVARGVNVPVHEARSATKTAAAVRAWGRSARRLDRDLEA